MSIGLREEMKRLVEKSRGERRGELEKCGEDRHTLKTLQPLASAPPARKILSPRLEPPTKRRPENRNQEREKSPETKSAARRTVALFRSIGYTSSIIILSLTGLGAFCLRERA